MSKRLFRSRNDRMVSGVCAGLAEYAGLPVDLVRVAFVVLTILSAGHAALAYLVMALLVPEAPVTSSQ